MSDDGKLVRRRTVFYVPGFDPQGPSRYHGLYRREAPLQAKINGMQIAVGDRKTRDRRHATWTVEAVEDGNRVETEFVFLRWDDIVRANWPRGAFTMFATMLSTYWQQFHSGFLRKLYATTWATSVAGAYPALFLVLGLLAGALAGTVVGLVIAWLAGITLWLWLPFAMAGGAAGIAYGGPWADRRFGVYWLIRIYTFVMPHARGEVAGIEQRFCEFAAELVDAAKANAVDEILIVGHSTGVQAAASIIGKALALDPRLGEHGPRISFLSLGGHIPLLAWQPEARWFRLELQRIADCPAIDWVDFSIPQDGACIALHDPFKSAGLRQPEGAEPRPKLLNLRLFELFPPERFKAIRHEWFTLHFRYLKAGELKGDYDYFAITAGCRLLAERYAQRESVRDFAVFRSRRFGHYAERLTHPPD